MTTTSSTAASSGASILTALDAGSGIDTAALVTSLVSATYDPKTSAITAKETANTAKVSSLATVSNGIDAFSTALTTLIAGGTLATQPTSSNASVLTATAKAGAQIGSLSAQLTVRQIAQPQSLVSGYFANSGATLGTGTITLASGSGSVDITIDASNNTLAGVARAINASKAGLTATIVTDANGARLTLKGPTGAANAFTLTPAPGADAGLSALAYRAAGMRVSGAAVVSSPLADATAAPVGQGSYTLTVGGSSQTLTIDPSNDTLNGLAAAINGAGLGLTAAIVTDSTGSRLSITDGSGGAPAFTLAPQAGAQSAAARFTYPAPADGMSRAQVAQDAIVRLDGIDITRPTNTIGDLIDGITLKLGAAAPNETITLGATRPTTAIKQGMSDFVAAYNELKTQIDTASAATTVDADGKATTGPLYNNSAIRQMQKQLSQLSSTVLNTGGGPRTLSEIGVKTNRDGTLSLDETLLDRQLATYPDAVEALFNPTQHASSPLIKITSAMGAAKPGTYQLTKIVAQTSDTAASGRIAGVPATATGAGLSAAASSKASGLVIEANGDVADATVTVDLGLGGALKAIRDSLRASGGVLDSLSTSLKTEKTSLADQLIKINEASATYRDRLTAQYATMTTRVSSYKATESYLKQQFAIRSEDN